MLMVKLRDGRLLDLDDINYMGTLAKKDKYQWFITVKNKGMDFTINITNQDKMDIEATIKENRGLSDMANLKVKTGCQNSMNSCPFYEGNR